jgi:5-formyltetrahydrofolate cyclo-ligase
MNSEKNQIRQMAKKFRDRLNASVDASDLVAEQFNLFISVPSQSIVSAYYPIGSELDPSLIVESLWSNNVKTCLPIVQPEERALKFVVWQKDTQLTQGKFGIFEPEDKSEFVEPDILIIPLLAFDQRGHRMGYGQGHYDATISALKHKKKIVTIGLAYAEQAVLLPLPTEPHDERLDFVVTPHHVFDFRTDKQ